MSVRSPHDPKQTITLIQSSGLTDKWVMITSQRYAHEAQRRRLQGSKKVFDFIDEEVNEIQT